jgi:hypothetical protein
MHPASTVSYTVDWTTMHAQLWYQVLAKYRGQPHISALEIGTYEGRSAVWFMNNILTASSSRLTCVDPWSSERLPAELAEPKFDAHVAPYGSRVCKVKSASLPFLLQATLEHWLYDFIYVDGDHRGYACLTDMVLAWQLLKNDGVMIVDDTGAAYSAHFRSCNKFPPPRVAADAFLAAFAGKYKLLHNGDQVVVQKQPAPYVTYTTRP